MRDTRNGLARLAALAGVEPSYRDAWGNEQRVSEATQRALLGALGLAADHPDEIEAGVRHLEELPFRMPLEPVLVAVRGQGRRAAIPVALPAEAGDARMEWRVDLESGRRLAGRVDFTGLERIGTRRIDGAMIERRRFRLLAPLPPGYHRFRLLVPGFADGEEPAMPLVSVPARCHLPAYGALSRNWGITAQLYGLRSRRNWGIGDFTDLAGMATLAARLGAAAVGLNPLHALYPANPRHASPYSPSHRHFLAIHYLDIEAIADFDECEAAREMVADGEFRARLEAARGSHFVDYGAVAALQRPVLERLYLSFREKHLGGQGTGMSSARAAAFRKFQKSRGASLQRLALFEALSEHFGAERGWRQWPEAYRNPAAPEVAAFATAYRHRVEFFAYLQWQADLQLDAAARAARPRLAIGLYHDMALAPDGNGAEAWADQHILARGASLGAPPDEWNQKGQDWGLPPYDPMALRAAAYEPFAALLRANMNHAGALRIDHVMGLQRLYWIPQGAGPREGGYVRYNRDDMIGILALESRRHKCLVIGEDLGTLPEGFQERMRAASMLSYRLLYFAKNSRGGFLSPSRYPAAAAVAVGTHDLATLAGYLAGKDLEIRDELDLYSSDRARAAAFDMRRGDIRALIRALKRSGLLSTRHAEEFESLSPELLVAVYRFLARTPARLLLVSPDDVLGEVEQVNLPGTTIEHPNWQRKVSVAVEELGGDPRLHAVAAAINEERGGASAGRPPRRGRRR